MSEAWDEIGPIADRAYAGEATFIENFPLTIERHGYAEQCYFTFCHSPIRDDTGLVMGMIDTVVETTGVVEAQKQARLLAGELGHRILKNTLSVVSAIVSQTLESAGVEGEAKTALGQRIGALAEAQSLLSRVHAAQAGLRDVVDQSLLPFDIGAGRFAIDGPPVDLSARQALMLALPLNELATKAIKYGALSSTSDAVNITWSLGTPADD